MVEQRTLNPLVDGSSPSAPTTKREFSASCDVLGTVQLFPRGVALSVSRTPVVHILMLDGLTFRTAKSPLVTCCLLATKLGRSTTIRAITMLSILHFEYRGDLAKWPHNNANPQNALERTPQ